MCIRDRSITSPSSVSSSSPPAKKEGKRCSRCRVVDGDSKNCHRRWTKPTKTTQPLKQSFSGLQQYFSQVTNYLMWYEYYQDAEYSLSVVQPSEECSRLTFGLSTSLSWERNVQSQLHSNNSRTNYRQDRRMLRARILLTRITLLIEVVHFEPGMES